LKEAAGVIPARYASRRFPGKPLAPINGKPMIQHVYERASEARRLSRLIVATDDERIADAAASFGAEVLMTSPRHRTGTERVAEVAENLSSPVVVNIQGDEPLIRGSLIDELVEALQGETIPMATLAARTDASASAADRNTVKVVMDRNGFALYFSRSTIPSSPGDFIWKHIGVYGYQRDFLLEFGALPPSRLEACEGLEQLRALENGYRIKVITTEVPLLSVDTPRDIILVENLLREEKDA